MSLKGVAAETLHILDAGQYQSKTGAVVAFRTELQAAIHGTRLYEPQQGRALLERDVAATAAAAVRIEVPEETTQQAAARLVRQMFEAFRARFPSSSSE